MRTLAKALGAACCLALGALAVGGLGGPPPAGPVAVGAVPPPEAGPGLAAGPAPLTPARPAAPPAPPAPEASRPDSTVADRDAARVAFDALPEAEQDARRGSVQDRMRGVLQAEALDHLLALQAEVGLDAEQTRRAGTLLDAEIDAILDLQQDALDGVPPEELAGELLATFEATEAEAATFLDGDQLDAFITMRRAG